MSKKKILSGILAMTMVFSLGVTSVSAMELTPEKLADTEKLDTVAGTYDGEAYNKYYFSLSYILPMAREGADCTLPSLVE